MPAVNEPSVAAREARVRRALAKEGQALRKDRSRMWSLHHQGGYMVVDPNHNWLVAGENYDLTLEELEAEIVERAAVS